MRHLKSFSSLSTRLRTQHVWGSFTKKALYKFTVIIIIKETQKKQVKDCSTAEEY